MVLCWLYRPNHTIYEVSLSNFQIHDEYSIYYFRSLIVGDDSASAGQLKMWWLDIQWGSCSTILCCWRHNSNGISTSGQYIIIAIDSIIPLLYIYNDVGSQAYHTSASIPTILDLDRCWCGSSVDSELSICYCMLCSLHQATYTDKEKK